MPSSRDNDTKRDNDPKLGPDPDAELERLSALGFGSDSALMREPKLLVDGRFLGALLAELEDELGATETRKVLFQIGLLHGLRDAFHLSTKLPGTDDGLSNPAAGDGPVATATLLAIGLAQRAGQTRPGAIDLAGTWPEAYEAEVRISRMGAGEIPCCALSAGYTSGWLSGTLEADIFVVEQSCRARGDARCSFRAAELSIWHETAEGRDQLGLLPALSYNRFREVHSRENNSQQANSQQANSQQVNSQQANRSNFAQVISHDEASRLDPEAGVVHIWGPVMVLPFTDVEEALLTVEALGREPATAEVRAVVVDLHGVELEDEFAVAVLEQVLDIVEAWGAEALLTGVAPLSESLVADLEATHLLVRKELPEAVATAFQIAEAQRHLL
ncbi:MAG: hypothetical protein JRG96_16530 [Deltaproteobacteria bacterium]|nr:hypothetical protein [Deltaproteobacteria bacterium]